MDEYRESRNASLDSILTELSEGLALIVRSASVESKDRYRLAYEKYQVDAWSATMVRSVQQMLSIVAELKRALLLNDFPSMIENTRDRLRTLEEVKRSFNLRRLQEELEEAVSEIALELNRA